MLRSITNPSVALCLPLKAELRRTKRWITVRGYGLTFVLAILWPLLSVPAQIFTIDYFAFWVLVSIAWGFGAAIIITFLPLIESQDEIMRVLSGMYNTVLGKTGTKSLRKQTMEDGSEEEPVKPVVEKFDVEDVPQDIDQVGSDDQMKEPTQP